MVWDHGSGSAGHNGVLSFLNSMARTLPPMMQVMMGIGGMEFSESLIKFTQPKEPARLAAAGAQANDARTTPLEDDDVGSHN